MGEWDVRLISASSVVVDGEPVIELFGRTRDKESITILCRGYLPYLYAVDPRPETAEILAKDPEVVSVEPDNLLYKSRQHDVLKVTLRNPWKVADFRNRLRKVGHPVLSADIAFHHRFFYDKDMGSCIRVRGEPTEGTYRTDLIVEMGSFENIDSFDPGLRILSFDIENSVLHDYIYTICAVVGEDGRITACEPITGTEKDIIAGFSELIRKLDPDVITGYNIDNYDIRKIEERAKVNKMQDALPWGRDGGQPKLISERFWRVKGRLICDAWWAAKKEIRPKQETLNAVALELLGEQKLDVDPRHMDEEWAKNREKVLEYCVRDAELALRILLEVGTLRKGMDLAAVSKLTVEDVLTSGSSQLADSLLIRAADRQKVAVPMMGARIAGAEQIEGGYVHNMTPGLYHWVCVLDFKSMYPSLIIAKNICFTTLSDDGEIRAPSGARFMSKDRREGLLPRILEDLMAERDSIKRRMKSAGDEHEYHYLDGLQAAVKVLMNTFYGVFASTFYRFTDKSIGAAITSFARANVKGIIEEVESEGIPVIYSDTDSVFMQSPEPSVEGSVSFGEKMASRYSRDGGTLEFEKLLEPMFTHGMKKRYVGRIVWPEVQDELLIRGYEVRRSDSFDLQSDMLTRLFELILDDRMDEALSFVKQTIQDVKSGNVTPERLVISKTCKGLDAYANPDSMANVQAAKKLMERGYEFIPGMKVSWIVTDSASSPQQVEPYVSGVPLEARPDYKYYVKRLAETASRITEVLGWSEKDLMMGSQQATLFGGTFGGSDGDQSKGSKIPKPKPKPSMKSLDDFLRAECRAPLRERRDTVPMARISEIGERALIEDFMSFIRKEGRIGPGDDAAVIGRDTVVTTDIVTFDRHFPAGMTYEQFGWYSAAVSFSDLAAMGARPIGFLAALALPPDLEAQAAYDIMSGIDQCCEFCGTGIAGGDTKFGPGIVAGTAVGSMDGRTPMVRTGAVPGDIVAVTGPIGSPAAGYLSLDLGLELEEARQSLYVPVPRVEEGIALAGTGIVTSCMDLSDGLGTALNTICKDSGVGIDVEFDFIPKGSGVAEAAEASGKDIQDILLYWGGEYELIFTADRERLQKLYDAGVEFSIIGMVNDGDRPELVRDGGRSRIGYGDY